VSAQTEAVALVALYDERVAMTHAMAEHPRPTGAMAQAIMDKGAELDAACEAFRRRHCPRKHRVIVGLRTVMAVSRTARSIVTVYDAHEASE
jgi:hypothetical protein